MKQNKAFLVGRKLLLTLLLVTSSTYAVTIDALALIVNDDPITLYDIEKRIS